MRKQVWSLASISGLRIWHCCELWYKLSATALIRLQAWDYAVGAALKSQKKKKKKKNTATPFIFPNLNISLTPLRLRNGWKFRVEVRPTDWGACLWGQNILVGRGHGKRLVGVPVLPFPRYVLGEGSASQPLLMWGLRVSWSLSCFILCMYIITTYMYVCNYYYNCHCS